MAANEIHLNDYGTIFRATILDGSTVVDISTAANKQFIFNPPATEINFAVSGVLVTDGTDGQIQYTTVSGDLNVAGNWCVQAAVTFPTSHWNTDIFKFKVHENI